MLFRSESQKHWDYLRAAGCQEGQGYFIGMPMLETDLMQWIASHG